MFDIFYYYNVKRQKFNKKKDSLEVYNRQVFVSSINQLSVWIEKIQRLYKEVGISWFLITQPSHVGKCVITEKAWVFTFTLSKSQWSLSDLPFRFRHRVIPDHFLKREEKKILTKVPKLAKVLNFESFELTRVLGLYTHGQMLYAIIQEKPSVLLV